MRWQSVDLQRPAETLKRTVFRRTLMAALAFAFAGSTVAAAQQTVYVGGSGKLPVEINLQAIDQRLTLSRTQPVLDPPGQAPRSAFLLGSAPTTPAAFLVKPLVAPTTTALTPSLSPPPPEPAPAVEPAPLTPVVSEPLPTPETVPAPVVAPEPAPVPAPVAAPEPVPTPEPTVAALAPTAAPSALGETLSIPFAGGSADLPDSAESNLQAVAASLAANDTLRAQVKAYADGATGSASSARRLSLSRALAVRSILIGFGVRSTRIDVRALGDRNDGGAPDRVDVLVINR